MDTTIDTPAITPGASPDIQSQADDANKQFDFQLIRSSLNQLVQHWKAEKDETEVRRRTRKIELDVEALRTSGEIAEDETFIPVRVIDTNIQREQPPYINYLKNSRRQAIFRCIDNAQLDTQLLEEQYTNGMTYLNWETPYFKCLDGAQTHGWDSVEVVYDESKPLHVGIEHIGHDKLFYHDTCKSIQEAPQLIREYNPTIIRLKQFVDEFGFNSQEVQKLIDKRKDSPTRADETVTIYKRLYKFNGIVYVCWFALEAGVSDWLKAPMQHYIGIDNKVTKPVEQPPDMFGNPQPPQQVNSWEPAPVTLYPIAFLPYRESEEQTMKEYKGRTYLDENKQEACTAILSAFVNRLTRSANIYGSPATEDGTGGSLKELSDIKLTNGKVLNKPFNFWSMEGPDPLLLTALEYMDKANANETNQVNFAVNNREDSRKTAKEISSSEQQQALLNGVSLTLFSTFVRTIHSIAWLVIQSQALQQKIKFLQVTIQQPIPSPITGQPMIDPQTNQPATNTIQVNNLPIIGLTYDVRAAGDVDVVQRQEKIQQMKQDWPVIVNTPLASQFLADLMKLEYPDNGEKYAQAVMSGDQVQQMQGMLMSMDTIIEGINKQHPEIFAALPPEQQQQLTQMMNMVKQMNAANQQKQQAQQGSPTTPQMK